MIKCARKLLTNEVWEWISNLITLYWAYYHLFLLGLKLIHIQRGPTCLLSWWRHQMETFSGPGEFPTQRPVTRSFDVFFDLRLNKRLNKHSWGWWFETLSWSLWRHHNVSSTCDLWPAFVIAPSSMQLLIHIIVAHQWYYKRGLLLVSIQLLRGIGQWYPTFLKWGQMKGQIFYFIYIRYS